MRAGAHGHATLFCRGGRCHVVWNLLHWIRARDWRADLRRPFDACPSTLDCRWCDRAVGPRGSDGRKSNAPKGSGRIAGVVPTFFGQLPIVPRAIDMGGPRWASEIVLT